MKTRKQARRPASPRRGRKRGTLALIGGLFITSALLRAGEEGIQFMALAAEGAASEEGGMTAHEENADPNGKAGALLEALRERESRLDKRERDLLIRMQALRVAETQIDERMTALADAEQQLRETLALAQSAAENDLKQLTDVYAQMKPRQAAALFEQMDPEFAAGFLGRMPPQSAAAIMAGLSPDAAYRVSVMLAGRNADVPKPADPPEPAPEP
ncbi:MotE family protein [Roseivivax halodurans]|nr:hypothetical protein [Roseivivax halodurans]